MLEPIRDWDDAFANMAHVAGSQALPDLWQKRAAAYRKSGVRLEEDIAYGNHARERLDIVWPDGPVKGLGVFIHGGYWMRLDKSFWTDLAEGARAHGWAVCLPSYTLAPEARVSRMTRQIVEAIEIAAARVRGPIRLCGHSAGGHLATRMICQDTALRADTLSRIEKVLSISGLHDLRPLMQTRMNEILHLDEAEAIAESAVLQRPAANIALTCWVGGAERPEFIRQTELMAHMWAGLDTRTDRFIDGEHNHFTVIEGLKDPASPITRSFIGAESLTPP